MITVNEKVEVSHSTTSSPKDSENKRNPLHPSKVYSDDVMDFWYRLDDKFHFPGHFNVYFYLMSGAMTQTVSQYVFTLFQINCYLKIIINAIIYSVVMQDLYVSILSQLLKKEAPQLAQKLSAAQVNSQYSFAVTKNGIIMELLNGNSEKNKVNI